MQNKLPVSICIPAYNEGKNIKKLLQGLIEQVTDKISIKKIVVVSSGCTDDTNKIVENYSNTHSYVSLIKQPTRTGKAAAINTFLETASEEIVVIESADTIPEKNTIEKLCEPFLYDKKIGMTGGAPIPVNDRNTFLGYIIHAWWWFHRNIPRFGEIIAYRNVLKKISADTAVDEAFIQAKLVQKGYKIVHIDKAVVHNKGAETVGDLIKQRRRVFNGHARLYEEENVKINNMTKSSVWLLLYKYKINTMKELIWLTGGILIEFYSRLLGLYDQALKRYNPTIWDTANSTKDLSVEMENLRI